MRSKAAYAGAWVVMTTLAASIAWKSLDFVNADSAAGPIISATVPTTSVGVTQPDQVVAVELESAASSSTTKPAEPATSASQQVFDLVGGSASVSFSQEGVSVLWASPAPGFGVKSDADGNALTIEFESDSYESKLVVWWDGGPRHTVEEGPED